MIGRGFIQGAGSPPVPSMFDAIVGPSGDYATIASACLGEAPGAIIGVQSGTIVETQDIVMLVGQTVFGLGWDDSTTIVTMGNFQWFMEEGCRVEGLRINTLNTANGEALFYSTTATANNWTVRNCKIDMSANTNWGWAFEWGTQNRNDNIVIENIRVIGSTTIENGIINAGGSALGTALSYRNRISQITATDMYLAPAGFAGANWLFNLQFGDTVVDDITVRCPQGTLDTSHGFMSVDGIVGGQEIWGNSFSNLTFTCQNALNSACAGIFTTTARSSFTNVNMFNVTEALRTNGQLWNMDGNMFENWNITNLYTYPGQTAIINLLNVAHQCLNNFHIESSQNVNMIKLGNQPSGQFGNFCVLSNFDLNNGGGGAGVPLIYVNGLGNALSNFAVRNLSGREDIYIESASNLNRFSNFQMSSPTTGGGATVEGDRTRFRDVGIDGYTIVPGGTFLIINGYYEGTVAPGVTADASDGFEVGDRWNDTTGLTYTCRDNTIGAAVWIADGISNADEIWDVLVDPVVGIGDYTTVGAALNGASAGATIGISPGNYDESGLDWTFKQGQTLFALGGVEGGAPANPSVRCAMGDKRIIIPNAGDNAIMRGIYVYFAHTTVGPDDLIDIDNATDIVIERCTFDFAGCTTPVNGIDASASPRGTYKDLKLLGNAQTTRHFVVSGTMGGTVVDNVYASGGSAPFAINNSSDLEGINLNKIYAELLDSYAGSVIADNGSGANIWTDITVLDDASGYVGWGMSIASPGTSVKGYKAIGVSVGLQINEDNVSLSDFYINDCDSGIAIGSGDSASLITNGRIINCVTRGVDFGGAGADRGMFTNVFIDASPTLGVRYDESSQTRWTNCTILNEVEIGNAGQPCNDNVFVNCYITLLTNAVNANRTVVDDCQIITLTDTGAFTKRGLEVHITNTAPTVNDDLNDGFVAGKSLWYDTSTNVMWKCDDASAGAAVWTSVGGGGYDFVTDVASPVTCASGNQYDNVGAAGPVIYNLPACARELRIRFVVMVAQNMQITANGLNVLSSNGVSSSAGGTATSNTPFSTIELVGLDNTNWIAVAQTGTWLFA